MEISQNDVGEFWIVDNGGHFIAGPYQTSDEATREYPDADIYLYDR